MQMQMIHTLSVFWGGVHSTVKKYCHTHTYVIDISIEKCASALSLYS